MIKRFLNKAGNAVFYLMALAFGYGTVVFFQKTNQSWHLDHETKAVVFNEKAVVHSEEIVEPPGEIIKHPEEIRASNQDPLESQEEIAEQSVGEEQEVVSSFPIENGDFQMTMPEHPEHPLLSNHAEGALLAAADTTAEMKSLPQKRRVNKYPIPKRLAAGHSEANGIGHRYGYTYLDMIAAPEYTLGRMLPLAEVIGYAFNNNTYAASAGLVFRYIPKIIGLLPGINLFYDYRQGKKRGFHDVGVGLEFLGDRFDFRANAYFPVGKKTSVVSHTVCDNYIGDFFAESTGSEFGYSGGDAEAGCLLAEMKGVILYVAAGPYYMQGKGKSFWGVEGRFQPQYKDFAALRVTLTSDPVFGTIVQGEVILSLPLYNFSALKNSSGPGGITNRQIYQPVVRRPISPLNGRCCWHSNF